MKNTYEIKGDDLIIHLIKKNGDRYETITDVSCLKTLEKLDVNWNAVKWPRSIHYYAQASAKNENGKYTSLLLHRVITNAKKGFVVDHINHDTLNNRLSNLRVVTYSQNNQNKTGANLANKTSKIRGVTWNKKNKRWFVQTQYKREKLYLGSFMDLKKAEKVFNDFCDKFFLTQNDNSTERKDYSVEEIREYVRKVREGYSTGKSNKKHIHYHKQTNKWATVYKGNHYGLHNTIDEAKEKLDKVMNTEHS